jgi:peptide/nickel transport system ATP-binding protein
LALLLVALGAPLIAPYDPQLPSGLPYAAPSAQHLLGTNDLGQDIFSELVYGARISLTIGMLAALFALVIGLIVALVAGYSGGTLDSVLMRVVDITLAFPFLPLVIVLAAFLGRGLFTTVIVIAAVIWARPARVLRSQVLKVRAFQHVRAAEAMGAATPYILARHVLPRLTPLCIAQFVRAATIAVLLEASLAFLGLNDPTLPSWGTMLFFANTHNAFLTSAWRWWILPPGLALTASVLGFAFLGYAIEEWADPRLKSAPGSAPTVRADSQSATDGARLEPAAADTVLAVRKLRVEYDTPDGVVRAVDGVSFDIQQGRVVGLVGESGCGKSTLTMALLRLLRRPGYLAGGSLLLNGRDMCRLSANEMIALRGRRISLIPQSAMNALNPSLTVHQQVAESAALTRSREQARARAHELLALVGIPDSRHAAYPHELSGGMRQRVVIAMAISNEPRLLIADEPLTGLDVLTQERILHLLLDLRARFGMAILLVSHDLPLVGRVVDDLLVMYAGRIVEAGRAREVLDAPRHPYTRALLEAFPSLLGPRRRLESIPGEPPDLLSPPAGCRFHPRCPRATAECLQIDPPLFDVGPGQQAACLLEQAR